MPVNSLEYALNKNSKTIIIAGGGAAGFFAAINLAEQVGGLNILILEKDLNVLSKVKISGGGKCNITNACFDVNTLIKNYPRGSKELISPFYSFGTAGTIKWFEERGVKLKTETDGRVFPVTDKSQTVIDCLMNFAKEQNIQIQNGKQISSINLTNRNSFVLSTKENEEFNADRLLITTGSNKNVWFELSKLGHNIIEPVPSLFTFDIDDELLRGLSGVSLENVGLSAGETRKKSSGPALITHSGLSGPAVLYLSAFAARELNRLNYAFELSVDWLPELSYEKIHSKIKETIRNNRKNTTGSISLFVLPGRLIERILIKSGIDKNKIWNEVSNRKVSLLVENLKSTKLSVKGKSTFKEEFVTAGGVDLKEINFKTMESKVIKNLFLAGEVLNIDALTGGFNFQSAWTTGWLAAKGIAGSINKNEMQEKK